ncbi:MULTISPECIES: hypothetical protein [Staphylococcus]|uniref:hypothetical protein n=4 Tax=Staphylococcus aureus TaxID=1280 RepID=UPI00044A20AA|nr:hypothetical protein [Staphylococcus aureus]EZR77994.1 hypothetical protein W778_01739 [Staphylococcus aureus VET1103S]EZT74454.1 hypothetical protein V107_01542 [Staphylococcus aureus 45(2607)]EZU12730.1 hypothetical protein U911_01483 [Staphylococcus aureus 07-03451]EZV61606.1 hypothetical protein V074_01607 [Staphylococcus aureus 2010-60-1240-1]EZX76260.1 hypothetical protein V110_01953 [Staphylococcus aureus Chi-8]EZZ44795.1 hypothetical protein V112_01643 [Staphylococcus aureus Tur-22
MERLSEIIEFINNKEILNILLGAFITILTGTAMFVIQSTMKYFFERRGNMYIYFKHVPSKVTSKPMCKSKEGKGLYRIQVPLWIEIHNTKEIKQIIRDFNIIAYYKNKKVDEFIQINEYTSNKIPLANNGSYSFIIDSNEIKTYELFFYLDTNKKIDMLNVRYFDGHDKPKIYTLKNFDGDMKLGIQDLESSWRKLNNSKKHSF